MKLSKKHANRIAELYNTLIVADKMMESCSNETYKLWRDDKAIADVALFTEYGIRTATAHLSELYLAGHMAK